jgi:hypothetical protein
MNRRTRKPQAGQKAETGFASSSSYEVGYGKPPRQYRFRRGQSGNPKGRPKGTKNTATLLREILDRKIEVRSGTGVRKISIREAMLTRFAESALEGDTRAATFLLQRYDAPGSAEAQENESADDQAIIDAFLKSYLGNRGEQE